MIMHCVFIRFKSATTSGEKQGIFDAITELKNVIPGILDVKCGQNVSSEGLNGGFMDGFIVTLDSIEARDEYLAHPQHMDVGERLMGLVDGGAAGLLVFDMAA
ncbi:Dabb family protein [Agrobacterium rubi]|uniref:Dabb family protein n=1 Tax=Agrobacterium rubi TaxID=28099 RepID=UPI001571FA81|nr:Dabb family protein [Agrobacterium rubi]NTF06660.1 Dabb family protein [Agrobacterium rubi]NTF18902.1 Dabb family protein [Agrobacterium rubi]NTF25865.1 Dabb family protein [Agrobacterium rubi]